DPAGGLSDGAVGLSAVSQAEAMQRRERAAEGDFKNRAPAAAISSCIRCSVEVPVAALIQHRDRIGAIDRVAVVQRGECALRSDFEDCSAAIAGADVQGPSSICCSVKVPVGGLNQTVRVTSIGQVETMQRS